MKLTEQQLDLVTFGFSIFKPKPILTGSEWADKYFYLSPESSARPGKWETDPWQVDILNEMTNDTTAFVDVMKSARVGYTKMLNITQGYYIHQDPCSILHAQPTDDEIRGYSEDEFEPMIRDNNVLKGLINGDTVRGRNKKEKTVKKMYPGGIWEGIGAHSPRNFRRRTARVTIGDEIDGWEFEAGKEGDPMILFHKRSSGFWNRKNITGGTPTLKDISKVFKRYEKGDQRERHLPCPNCGHMQILEFENLHWKLNDDGDLLPDSVVFQCVSCEKEIHEEKKRWMDENGAWIAKKPFKDRASFRIWSAYAHDPSYRWRDIVQEHLDAKDDALAMKGFTNTVLGLPWEEKHEANSVDDLLLLTNDMKPGIVPPDTAALVMTVDVQLDHFWYKLNALKYGAGKHGIRYGRAETWRELEQIMYTHYPDANSVTHMVSMCAVDSGFKTDEVYEFCAMNSDLCIPVKGASGKPATPWNVSSVEKDINGETIKTGLKRYVIDTEYFKDMLHAQIQRSILMAKEGTETKDNLYSVHCEADKGFAKQLTSEYKHCDVNKKTGVEKWSWRKVSTKADNHLWDCDVYATFLSELLGIRFLERESIKRQEPKQNRPSRIPSRSERDDYMDNY